MDVNTMEATTGDAGELWEFIGERANVMFQEAWSEMTETISEEHLIWVRERIKAGEWDEYVERRRAEWCNDLDAEGKSRMYAVYYGWITGLLAIDCPRDAVQVAVRENDEDELQTGLFVGDDLVDTFTWHEMGLQ